MDSVHFRPTVEPESQEIGMHPADKDFAVSYLGFVDSAWLEFDLSFQINVLRSEQSLIQVRV